MARRWTAVDRETGELLEFSSRTAMRQAVRDNPSLISREREDIYEHRAASNLPRVGPLWSGTQWTANAISIPRERTFDTATAGLRYSFLAALSDHNAEAAARIRTGWANNAQAYAEGKIDANTYEAGMKELVGWLMTTPYAPPVAIWYHEGSDDYDGDDYDQPDWDDDGGEEYEP